jgi:hypothetical protein
LALEALEILGSQTRQERFAPIEQVWLKPGEREAEQFESSQRNGEQGRPENGPA